MYDYEAEMKKDVEEWILENIDLTEWAGNREKLEEKLNNDLFCEDSITGNASGSYYFNSYKAEESICHNLDLLSEALFEFGESATDVLEKGAEWADVSIRCYLLPTIISDVLDDMEKNGDFDESEEE